jgi:hypothetical protein
LISPKEKHRIENSVHHRKRRYVLQSHQRWWKR